jgi:hypothetical protein
MKIAIVLSSLFSLGLVWANTPACFSIRDPDRKNVCLAMSSRQNSYCFSVKDADTKNMCLANVMNGKKLLLQHQTARHEAAVLGASKIVKLNTIV